MGLGFPDNIGEEGLKSCIDIEPGVGRCECDTGLLDGEPQFVDLAKDVQGMRAWLEVGFFEDRA